MTSPIFIPSYEGSPSEGSSDISGDITPKNIHSLYNKNTGPSYSVEAHTMNVEGLKGTITYQWVTRNTSPRSGREVSYRSSLTPDNPTSPSTTFTFTSSASSENVNYTVTCVATGSISGETSASVLLYFSVRTY